MRPTLLSLVGLAVLSIAYLGGGVVMGFSSVFRVSTTTVAVTMEPVTTHEVVMDITIPPTEEDPGYSQYFIAGNPHCNAWDPETYECTDQIPSLCPYLSIGLTGASDGDQSPYGVLNQYFAGFGDLTPPSDPSDEWAFTIHAPCFEGECPLGYDSLVSGNPLPQSMKGQTFRCDVSVDPFLAPSTLGTKTAYAQSAPDMPENVMVVTATFGMESTPPAPTCTENCNSNVMFLPGLQASRLYKDGAIGDNTLWEPNNKGDVRDLNLDAHGKSLDPSIFTKDILDEAFGFGPDIYKTFIEMMDGLETSGKITDWSAIPYDWRLTLGDIIDNGTLVDGDHLVYSQASSSPHIFETFGRLASSSRTGKVTIIAHSNGGLVAKALTIRLADMGKAGLVDKVILVAAPQLGTPKAIASLLHGEGQELGGGFLLDKATARGLGENMPGAFHLLPSEKYFEVVQDAPVLIRQKSSTQAMFDIYGSSTESYGELESFLKGIEGRTAPDFSDWETPAVLNDEILNYATGIHSSIDAWSPPLGVEVVEIAGWGRETIKGIRYSDRFDDGCQCNRITYTPLFTDEGDETVVVPSALATASTTRYWVDLPGANEFFEKNWDHGSILEAAPLQGLLGILLRNESVGQDFISSSAPIIGNARKLRYTLHSPLSLRAFDEAGRYTGVSTSTISGVEWELVIKEIPNSTYLEFGETKILSLPEHQGNITMIGESLGIFTLDIEEVVGGATISTRSFPDIPVATGTVVSVVEAGASTTLAVDFDANGTPDIIVGEDGFTDMDGVTLLRQLILDLKLGTKQEKRLLGVIQRLEKAVAKDWKKEDRRVKRLSAILSRLSIVIETMKSKGKVSTDDSTELHRVIQMIRTEVL